VTDQKQPENAAYFKYLGSLTSDASCVRENISRILVVKAAFNKKKTHFITKLDSNLMGGGDKSEMLHLEHSTSEIPEKF
jgi:hypothetical protein